MGNIDTKFVTAEEMKLNRELLMAEFAKTGVISDNMLKQHCNDNLNMTIRLIAKWTLQAILAIAGVSNIFMKIVSLF